MQDPLGEHLPDDLPDAEPSSLPPRRVRPRTLGGTRWILFGLCGCAALLSLSLLAPRLQVSPAQAVELPMSSLSGVQGPWNGWSDLAFVSPTEGWAVGYAEPCATNLLSSCTPRLKHYLQGAWSAVPLAFPGWLTTISMLSPRDGWAGGYDGLLLHYDGVTWQHQALAQRVSLLHLQMLSDTDGWAVGSTNTSNGTGVWYYDGQTWTQEGPRSMRLQGTQYDLTIQALAMVSPTEGWATGMLVQQQSGTHPTAPQRYGGAVVLHDLAGRWSLAARIPDGNLTTLSMTSATEGWAMGNTEGTQPATPTPAVKETPLLLHYTQGHWKQVANPVANPLVCCLSTVTMRVASDGWAAGPESGLEPLPLTAMVHYTGGRWTNVHMPVVVNTSATITRIVMTSSTEGWAGGALTRTSSRTGAPDATTPLILHYQHGVWNITGS